MSFGTTAGVMVCRLVGSTDSGSTTCDFFLWLMNFLSMDHLGWARKRVEKTWHYGLFGIPRYLLLSFVMLNGFMAGRLVFLLSNDTQQHVLQTFLLSFGVEKP
jgi:hypothetical protein